MKGLVRSWVRGSVGGRLRFGTRLHESLGDWSGKRLGGRMCEGLDELTIIISSKSNIKILHKLF